MHTLLTVVTLLVLWAGPVAAQTVQQDRRIEEQQRQDLQPTVAEPRTPTAHHAPEAPQAAPVPPPLAGLYFLQVMPKRVVFHYDAAKAIVILMGVDEDYIDLNSQVAYLREHQFLPARLEKTFDPMQPLRKGVAAYLFQRALGLRGGLTLRLFGPSERYALKELVFQGLLSSGHVNDLVSGEELVQLMAQAVQYKLARQPTRH